MCVCVFACECTYSLKIISVAAGRNEAIRSPLVAGATTAADDILALEC